METLSDLNTFAKILTEKGYNGYFHTQGAYAGKLKESISDYLESCQKGADTLPKQDLLLTGYLQWSGEDKPSVECSMWVNYLNGKFSLNRMEVARKDQFGQLLKKSELTNLSLIVVPNAVEVIALVNDEQKQNVGKISKRFKL
ncbi:hypothetical protein H3Z85_16625 [Chryseobacterium indologenes]|jgi:hypothetical protein|uniref:Uncharacterized protein n=6 Tax=Flavobacteriales TaxID=200644 RepID=A0A3G6T6D6_9FLAO|nr:MULTISPECIES: hypothetical protein [Bacteroidota]MDV3664710.1 hypothetical protein [Elizabethkingia anophelis]AZB23377.1 hypothetical protein EG339_01435 [Chryseobacterium bernardetii]EFK33925.1 hypothetical protein HMPREF0204_12994 [Chryseobacterium gleum ATCC 35910]MBG0514604.1 hypothetical protein [Elizabethkingia meningoseptica]MCC9074008.1 hypothetical protein [Flavobacterium sp. F-65]